MDKDFDTGQIVKDMMQRRGIRTNSEIDKRCGFGPGRINNIKKSKDCMVSTLVTICDALDYQIIIKSKRND